MGQHSNDAEDALFKEADSSGASDEEPWSIGLRLHMERQCEMWADIAARVERNARVLGTARMRLYSPDERKALATMMANMKQLLDRVNGDLGKSIALTHSRLDAALQAYDAFIDHSGSGLRT